MTAASDHHRPITEAWRAETMVEHNLNEELQNLLDGAPRTTAALRQLAECYDLDLLYDLIDLCIRVEESYPSQGWRIAWTRAAEQAIPRMLSSRHHVSGNAATEAFWSAAAGFAERVRDDPETAEVSIPTQGVNIGWILGTGPADAAKDALTVISMEAILAMNEDRA